MLTGPGGSVPISVYGVAGRPGEINRVITTFLNSESGPVMTAHKGKRGNPLIIDMKYFDEVLSLPDAEGLRAVADRLGYLPSKALAGREMGRACGTDAGTWAALKAGVEADMTSGRVKVTE